MCAIAPCANGTLPFLQRFFLAETHTECSVEYKAFRRSSCSLGFFVFNLWLEVKYCAFNQSLWLYSTDSLFLCVIPPIQIIFSTLLIKFYMHEKVNQSSSLITLLMSISFIIPFRNPSWISLYHKYCIRTCSILSFSLPQLHLALSMYPFLASESFKL